MIRCFLALFVALQAAYAVDLTPLEQITVQEGGRKKPFLVFAEESLLGLSGKTALTIDGRKMSATEVITTLWLNPQGWDSKPVLLVNHKPLKEASGLETSRKLFSYRELASNRELVKLLNEAQALRARPGNQRLTGLPKEAAEVGLRIAEFESLVNGSAFRFVANPRAADAQWLSVPGASGTLNPLRAAFEANDTAAFAKEAKALRTQWSGIEPQFQPPAWKIQLETLYQKAHPFRWAWMCYAAAGIILLLSNLGRAGYAAAWVLAGAGFLLQVAGFAARVTIAGRAPVTNMYESVVWVAFGTILFALVFEAIYRSRYFLLGAVPVAVASLILADTQTLALNRSINPLVPVDLVIDHSVQVDFFGSADAFKKNVEIEYERNKERYEFLRWGAGAFNNFRVVPPGTGICHQVNLEYLAQTVWTKEAGRTTQAFPDTCVGTDSHTTMVNALGVLGWGVGGIEAEAAMLGQPVAMVIPEVIGFGFKGKLKEGVTATDLVLTCTQMLRKRGVVEKFV